MTRWSSLPSTSNVLALGKSAYLYVVARRYCKLLLIGHGWYNVIALASQANEHTLFVRFSCDLLKGPYCVSTVSCCEDLDVKLCGNVKDHSPDIRLHGMVQTVLELVYQQYAVPGIHEVQG